MTALQFSVGLGTLDLKKVVYTLLLYYRCIGAVDINWNDANHTNQQSI